MIDARRLTLAEALTRLGYVYERTACTASYRRHVLRADRSVAFTGTAAEAWDWLASTGQILRASPSSTSIHTDKDL